MKYYSLQITRNIAAVEQEIPVLVIAPVSVGIETIKLSVFSNFLRNNVNQNMTKMMKKIIDFFDELIKFDREDIDIWVNSYDPNDSYCMPISKEIRPSSVILDISCDTDNLERATENFAKLMKIKSIDIAEEISFLYRLITTNLKNDENILNQFLSLEKSYPNYFVALAKKINDEVKQKGLTSLTYGDFADVCLNI